MKTAQMTSMIFVILIGATLFGLVFRGFGGDGLVHRALTDLPGGTAGAILAVMLAMFLLGFVMDAFEIIFVVVPIVAPILLAMPGVDPVWLGIIDGDESADLLYPSAARTDAVLPARGGAAAKSPRGTSMSASSRSSRSSLRLWSCCGSCRRWRPLCRARFMGADKHEGVVSVRSDRRGGAGDRRIVGAWRALRAGAGGERREGRAGRAAQGSAGRTMCERIAGAGGTALAVEADVLDRAAMLRAFDDAQAAFGTVTILVNNAGAAQSVRALDMTEDRMAARDLGRSRRGLRLVAGRRAPHAGRRPARRDRQYSPRCWALACRRAWRPMPSPRPAWCNSPRRSPLELAFKGVRVNAIAPGWFVTEINEAFLQERKGRGR